MKRYALAAILLCGAMDAASAQGVPTPQASPVIFPTAATLAVTGASANVALPSAPVGNASAYPAALVTNVGAAEAFVALGSSGVTATTGGVPVEPGNCVPIWVGASAQVPTAPTNIAAVTAAGSTTLRITQATSLQACHGGPGSVTTTPSATTHVQSAALAANLVVDAAPGHLLSFQVSADSTLSAAAWWLLVFDATSAPADGSVTPAKCYAYPAGTTAASYGFASPPAFTSGIVLSVSTTGCFTKTASAHAFLAGDFQ